MKYTRYFLYLAWNWNLRLAWFVLLNEIRGEKKYQQNTLGIDDLKGEISEPELQHASIYQPVNYYTAERLFDNTVLEDVSGSLLDLGCGKGRVFGLGAAYGFPEVIGVDFSDSLCKDALKTAMQHREVYPETRFRVVHQDAGEYMIPNTVTTIFLFNPFDATVMRKVIRNINASMIAKPRSLKILYANPVHKHLFIEAGFIETDYFQRMKYLEGSVLEK